MQPSRFLFIHSLHPLMPNDFFFSQNNAFVHHSGYTEEHLLPGHSMLMLTILTRKKHCQVAYRIPAMGSHSGESVLLF